MNRYTAGGLALVSVLWGKVSIACRLRRPPEGWRRTVGILLRSEPTRFAVSAFGLHVPGGAASDSPQRIERLAAEALREYLSHTPDAHFCLEWLPAVTRRRRIEAVDVALLEFDEHGALTALVPYLADAASAPLNDAQRSRVFDAIVSAYNRTRRLPEIDRPVSLRRAVLDQIGSGDPASAAFARRLLAATCVSFEERPSGEAARFVPPQFRLRRSLGFGILACVIRHCAMPGDIDVWVSAHHVGLDGVPLQELLSGLEREWGSDSPDFPAPDIDQPFMLPRVCSVEGERVVDETLSFVDFSPVIELRRAVNARFADRLRAPATFGAILAWVLEAEPEFADVRIASTVDVAASNGYDRDVDVVPLRPADFAAGPDRWNGLIEFANEFNRLIALSRERRSPLREGMSTAGLLPPAVHAHVVRANPAALDDTFGSLCITIIREAKVFVAPMTDLGLGHGFFAIGSTTLRSAAGMPVTAVSIKGDSGRISGHHAALRRAIARSATLAAAVSTPSDSHITRSERR
jgi:hypothetical protein